VGPGSSSIFCAGRLHVSITQRLTFLSSFCSFRRSLLTKSSSGIVWFQLLGPRLIEIL
jgi:hypothetical protein